MHTINNRETRSSVNSILAPMVVAADYINTSSSLQLYEDVRPRVVLRP